MRFQDIIFTLHSFWAKRGCVMQQPYDMEVGAGTFHPATFLRCARAPNPGMWPMCSLPDGQRTDATGRIPTVCSTFTSSR